MKGTTVIYNDLKGLGHEALVFAVNPFDETRISLVYIDESKPDADNVVKLFDVRHMDSISEYRVVESNRIDESTGKPFVVEEGNKGLPTYHLNCWKEKYELSNALPSDHPAYDHPHRKVVDQDGNVIPVARPEYDAQVAAHQASSQADGVAPSAADLDAVASEQEAADLTSSDVPPATE